MDEGLEVQAAVSRLHESIDIERLHKEKERFETLNKIYGFFMNASPELKDAVYLNRSLLKIVVKSYFDDIYKFKVYTRSVRANEHKQAAYLIKWISRIRPIQILPKATTSDLVLLANAQYAVFVGFSFLFKEDEFQIIEKMNERYYQELIYTAQYRNISGKTLAFALSALQGLCRGSADANKLLI